MGCSRAIARSHRPRVRQFLQRLIIWERHRAVLVDVSYLAVDALEGALVKGDYRIARVWAHRARLEKRASKKWDNGEYEDVAGMLRLQITAEDLLAD